MHWINTQTQMDKVCQMLWDEKILALDTEFMRRNSFYPIPALIQIGTAQDRFLIDVCSAAISSWQGLKELLENDSVKIVHACREDIEVVFRLTGANISNLFDTQIAAHFLGLGGQVSYQTLVAQLLNQDVAKLHTLINWCRRPLSASEMHYAEEDILYLPELYEKMQHHPHINLILAETEMVKAHVMRAATTPDPYAYLRWGHLRGLNTQQAYWLRELLLWRESVARAQNTLLKRILTDETIAQMVYSPSLSSLLEKIETSKLKGSNLNEYQWRIESIGRTAPADFVWISNHNEMDFIKSTKSMVEKMQEKVDEIARSLKLPSTVLSRKKHLIELLHYAGESNKRPLPFVLLSWRRAIVGEFLLKMVDVPVSG